MKDSLSLNLIFDKILRRFIDKYPYFVLESGRNDTWLYIKKERRIASRYKLMILLPLQICDPEYKNFHFNTRDDIEEIFGQKINATLAGKIKSHNHGEIYFAKNFLQNLTSDFRGNQTQTLERHLQEFVENSIKYNKYRQQKKIHVQPEKYENTTFSSTVISNIDCNEEKTEFEVSVKEILLSDKKFVDVIKKEHIEGFLGALGENIETINVYRYLAYIIVKAACEIKCIDCDSKNKLNTPIQNLIEVVNSRKSEAVHSSEMTIVPKDIAPIQTHTKVQKNKINFYKYDELRKLGLTNDSIAKQILVNERKSFDANCVKRLINHIEQAPEQFGFLCLDEKTIIGGYRCVYLTQEQEAKLRKGLLRDAEISPNSVKHPYSLQRNEEASLYFMGLSIDKKYANSKNWNIVFTSLSNFIRNEIKKGIRITNLYTTSSRNELNYVFIGNGFSKLIKRNEGGYIFHIDLLQQNLPVNCDWLSWAEPLNECDFSFRKMTVQDLRNRSLLKEVAILIHATDQYIYNEGMFSREQAQKLLPSLFSKKDRMFNVNNLYLALQNKRVVGIILSKNGPLNWNSDGLKEIAEFYREPLNDNLELVEKSYFRRYDAVDDNTISIINCCVHSNMKILYGTELEDLLLKNFIRNNEEKDMILYVLTETEDEFDLFINNGFKLKQNLQGFNVHDSDLPSSLLSRTRTSNKTGTSK